MKNLKCFIPVIMIVLILAGVFAVWMTNSINFELYNNESISYVRGKVIAVNSQEIEPYDELPGRNIGTQNITVRLSDKREITFDNILSTTHSIEVGVGTRVIVKCDEPEGITPGYSLYNYDRSIGIILAFVLFIAVICLVGKIKGLYAAIALVVSMLIIGGGLVPAVYNGHSVIIATLITCMAIASVTLLLLNGFSAKTGAAIFSTLIGLGASAILYAVVAKLISVSGYNLEETETMILIARATKLKIGEILFSSILLASLGAVMDTAMSIASALFEIAENKADISKKALYKSGMNIGSDMIGTMCQTLVLAFTGGSVASIIIMLANGTALHRFLSSDFLALEILQALTGSFAVILTVPITAYFCSVLHNPKKKSSR
ncbi:MAG: YibE/F family protein [Clostridia bacterium]|nr:YibE/F family protein [Clostridia bacterium]